MPPTSEALPAIDIPTLERASLFPRLAAVVALSTVVTTGLLGAAYESPAGECQPASAESVATVTELLEPQGLIPQTSNPYSNSRHMDAYDADLRKRLGIVLPVQDMKKYNELREANGQNADAPAQPFSKYQAHAVSVLKQSGVQLSIGRPRAAEIGEEVTTPTPQELETPNAKSQVLGIADIFAIAPVNLTKKLGIKEVALVSNGKGYGGKALIENGVFVINLSGTNEDGSPSDHEYAHLVDAGECSAKKMFNDPTFTAINRDDEAAYGPDYDTPLTDAELAAQPKTFEDISEEHHALRILKRKAAKAGDTEAYNDAVTQTDTLVQDVEMMRSYDHRSVVEDKADIGLNLLHPENYSDMENPKRPKIRQKFIELLARLYTLAPDVATYYISIGNAHHRQLNS